MLSVRVVTMVTVTMTKSMISLKQHIPHVFYSFCTVPQAVNDYNF